MRLIIVSGLSGSGKSIALNTLEDLGYYCIDNLPISLLQAFATQLLQSGEKIYPQVAVGIDARNQPAHIAQFPQIVQELKKIGIDCEIFLLQAETETLLKRFSETRRRHPLTNTVVALADAIQIERGLLEPISMRADMCIDTTHTNVHQLRDLIRKRVGAETARILSLLFQSFGFKSGLPSDADFVFDVRCLPNPHWESRLRAFTGRDPEVAKFLAAQPPVTQMYKELKEFLKRWIPCFEANNRSYMTVAIGCTGGQHRSVYMVERLAKYFRRTRKNVLTRHRELS